MLGFMFSDKRVIQLEHKNGVVLYVKKAWDFLFI